MPRHLLLPLLLLAAALSAAPARAQSPPGGPILVVVDDADPFGRYYGEILRAEGLNEFSVASVATVSAQGLAGYDVLLLAATALTDAQVSAIGGWVEGGGSLVAMRPAPQLAGVLGLGTVTDTLADGYLKVATGSPPGAGITGETLQFHGVADRWTLAGATPVATLYADAATPTSAPAVTLHSVGGAGGQAAAFTYDLARSIVHTRQGNPARAGQERDANPPIRTDDLFFDGWLDFDKVAIPQADEQQRLLANLITLMSSDRTPLPRFWYLPRGEKAVVVQTGDDHDSHRGTSGQFAMFDAASPAGCSVADWECVRATSYAFPSKAIMTDAQAAAYQAKGFEIGLHPTVSGTTACSDFTAASLASAWSSQLGTFHSTWPSLRSPRTSRTHCVPWSTWAGEATAALAHGVRLDTNYYYWPGSWVQGRPGLFTGSGFPMRFADANGALIDVYQATTQINDELGSSTTDVAYVREHIGALLDRALGAKGYYAVVTTNMHTDDAVHAGANAIVEEALARDVPIVSAEQMLDWLDGRNNSSFQDVRFDAGRLTFTVAQAAGARGLQAMIPARAATGALTALTRDGAPVAVTARAVKGLEYVAFDAVPGAYVGTYGAGPALTPPPLALPSQPRDDSAPRVRLLRHRLDVSRRGITVLRVRCPQTEDRCVISLRLRRYGKRLARARFVVAGGKTADVRLRLARSVRARLGRRGSLWATVAIDARDAAGNRRVSKTAVRLIAPRAQA